MRTRLPLKRFNERAFALLKIGKNAVVLKSFLITRQHLSGGQCINVMQIPANRFKKRKSLALIGCLLLHQSILVAAHCMTGHKSYYTGQITLPHTCEEIHYVIVELYAVSQVILYLLRTRALQP